MTFHRVKDISPSPHDLVCREAAWPRALGALFLIGGGAGLYFVPVVGCARMGVLALAAMLALLGLMFVKMFLRTFGPQNWLMRVNARGVWIKFRSFANAHFNDEDEVVVKFEPREIAWVGRLREHLISPGSERGHTQHQWITFLEIGLRDVDLAELDRRLTEERNRKAPGKYVRSKTHDYPVRLVEGSTLRIPWRGAANRFKPSLKRILPEMARFTQVREPRKIRTDTITPAADKAAQEAQILDLAERGDVFAAAKLARARYGFSLTEARQFVDELLSRGPSDKQNDPGAQ